MLVGEKIKLLRESNGWSLGKLATYSGLGKTTIFKLESGESQDVKLVTLELLAKAFKIPVQALSDSSSAFLMEIPEELKQLGVRFLVVDDGAQHNKLTPEETIRLSSAIMQQQQINKKANQS